MLTVFRAGVPKAGLEVKCSPGKAEALVRPPKRCRSLAALDLGVPNSEQMQGQALETRVGHPFSGMVGWVSPEVMLT